MWRFVPQEKVGSLARQVSLTDRRTHYVILGLGLAVIVTITAIWLVMVDSSDIRYWKALGYPGIFLLNFIGSVAIIVPVPGLIAVCGAGGLNFNPIAIGLIAGTAETLGEMSGYAIGFGSRTMLEKRPVYEKLASWMKRRGSVVLFVVSVIPNPVFDIIGIISGGLRYPLVKFLGIVWVGKTIKGLIVVHTCSWIIQYLPFIN
jgi:membrane protein YqaA with SNARE-associated domain